MVGPIIWLAILFALMLAVRVAIILVFDREESGATASDPNALAKVIHRADWSTDTPPDPSTASEETTGKESA